MYVVMNYSKYYKSMKTMEDPVMPSQLPKVKMDSNGLVAYARKNGKSVVELSEAEKRQFIEMDK